MSNQFDFQEYLSSLGNRSVRTASPANNNPQGRNDSTYSRNGFPPPHDYHNPSISSPIVSPPLTDFPRPHSAAIISPRTTHTASPVIGMESTSSDRTASLLNLLKFNQPSSSTAFTQPPVPEVPQQAQRAFSGTHAASSHSVHGRGVSASDLAASFMGKPTVSSAGAEKSSMAQASTEQRKLKIGAEGGAVPTDKSQELLLRLLSQTTANNASQPSLVSTSAGDNIKDTQSQNESPSDSRKASIQSQENSPSKAASPLPLPTVTGPQMHLFATEDASKSASFQPPQSLPEKDKSIFTYVNPFEQLAASSPRNRTPGTEEPVVLADRSASIFKPKIDGKEAAVPDSRQEFNDSLGREADNLANKMTLENKSENASSSLEDDIPEEPQDLVPEVKDESDRSETKRILKEACPNLGVETIDGTVEEVTDGNVGVSYLGADGDENKTQERIVRVFNFPMRPFVSIEINPIKDSLVTFREDSILDVARFKKEFDQIDRTLASATSEFVVYALPKYGFRVIRQDDGLERQVFRGARDRIFNLAISKTPGTSAKSKEQTVIATGVSGAVFCSPISDTRTFADDGKPVELQSLVFPPVPSPDSQTSGGQLKTRARKSSRHPEFFAIGRGKAIHIISPKDAISYVYPVSVSGYRRVDTERFFKERTMKISTGKAGKDFTFSDDDTLIVSLDKAGRLRFWDVRPLLEEKGDAFTRSTEVKMPLLSLSTTSPTEKSWPTSVLFVDKYRPYSKEIALRYLLVGMKQNHTLQLWDLGLGKAVQELNFPHENESDAICSISYHPSSGIIVVGHPTRNSIYFIHLSAPRYNLPAMSQAKYLEHIAEHNSNLPKPEATAIMSGLREFSFASKGELRSVELLPRANGTAGNLGDDPVLFELYVAHSKGVTYLTIKKEDLGWSTQKDYKVLHPVDAEEYGAIIVKDLREPTEPSSDRSSINGEQTTSKDKKRSEPASRIASPIPIPQKPILLASKVKNTEKQDIQRPPSAQKQDQTGNNVEKSRKKRKGGAISDSISIGGTTNAILSNPQAKPQMFNATGNNSRPQAENPTNIEIQKQQFEINDNAIPVTKALFATSTIGDLTEEQINNMGAQLARDFARKLDRQLETLRPYFESVKNSFDASKLFENAVQDLNLDNRSFDAKNFEHLTAEFRHIFDDKLGSYFNDIKSTLYSNIGLETPQLGEELKLTGHFDSLRKDLDYTKKFEELYEHLANDRRVQDAAGVAKQEAVLRLISTTLSSNIEKSLTRIVNNGMKEDVVPGLNNSVGPLLAERLEIVVQNNLSKIIPRELKAFLPGVISKTLVNPDFVHLVADQVAKEIAPKFESDLGRISEAQKRYTFATNDLYEKNSKYQTEQIMGHLKGVLDQNAKYLQTIQSLTQKIDELGRSQAQTQQQLGRLYEMVSPNQPVGGPTQPVQSPHREPSEIEQIVELMEAGKYDEGATKWLQYSHPDELFENFFVHYDPNFLGTVSPLVLLSVATSITMNLNSHLDARLHWLEVILNSLNPNAPEIKDVLPRILSIIRGRLQNSYMAIAETNPNHQALRRISSLSHTIQDILDYIH